MVMLYRLKINTSSSQDSIVDITIPSRDSQGTHRVEVAARERAEVDS